MVVFTWTHDHGWPSGGTLPHQAHALRASEQGTPSAPGTVVTGRS